MGQPYGPGYQVTPPPKKKKKVGLIVLICVLVIALLGGGGGFAYWWFAMRDDTSQPVVAGQARFPQAAVRGYLQALAAGNSADALSFVNNAPVGNPFLTDAVLSVSLAANPITDIEAVKDSGSSKTAPTVTATYKIGSQSVSADYTTVQVGKYYFLAVGTQQVDLNDAIVYGVDMSLNGVLVNSSYSVAPLFPGTYQLAIGNSMLSMSSEPFVVTDPYATTTVSSATITLAPEAQSKLAAAAKSTLDGCMAEKKMLTSCDFGFIGFDDYTTPDESTVKWTFLKGKSDFSNTKFQYKPDVNITRVDAAISLQLQLSLRNTAGKGPYTGKVNITAVHIDFSDPDNLYVSFDSSEV